MKKDKYIEFTLEQQIVNELLLRSSIATNIGLFDGKMGLILFFAHYFKHSVKPVFDDTAGDLMDELMQEIHTEIPIDLASGLSGIGWGVEYLIQNSFVEGDSLEVCEEIDTKIMKYDLLRITDYSLETGLEGLLHYALAHIKGVMSQHSNLPFDEMYLSDLLQAVTNIPKGTELSENFKNISSKYSAFYKNRSRIDYSFQPLSFIEDIEIEKNKLDSFPLGIKKGLSGYMLRKLISN